MNLPKLIKMNKLFYNFEDKEINGVFDNLKGRLVKYSRGMILAKEGSDVSEIGILLSGTLLKFLTKPDGTKDALETLQQGGMFGDIEGFLPNSTLSYSVVAAEDVTVLYITISTIVAHSSENSPFHQKLLENLLASFAERIKVIHKDTEYLLIKSMRLKIAKFIYDKYLQQKTLDVSLGINRNEMAKYLNVSRPSMSREMQRMRDEGIFEFRKDKIFIKNLSALGMIVEAK